MPGIVLTTATATGPSGTTANPTSTLFVAGQTEKGPQGGALLVSSLADYILLYGNSISTAYTYETVETFFQEGGTRCFISRAIPDGAVSASSSLVDSATLEALKLLASGEGTWANTQLTASVVNSTTSFKVKVKSNTVIVYSSPAFTTVAQAVSEINSSAQARIYVSAVPGASALLPATVTDKVFAGGADGDVTMDAGDVVEAIAVFGSVTGPGAVCAPGMYDDTVYDALIAHAKSMNRVALLGFGQNETSSGAIAKADEYQETAGADGAAWFYPWVKIPRGEISISVPCEGYVAGKRAKQHNQVGSWAAYAGIKTQAQFVSGVEYAIGSAAGNLLDAGNVNPIRLIAGGVRIYGARSASSDNANYRYINARETLNYIVTQAELKLESLVFSVIDGRQSLFGEVQAVLVSLLDPLSTSGGLFSAYDLNGKFIDPGYKVNVSDAINPLSQLATGVVKAKVSCRVSSIGDTIEVEITKSNLVSTLG